jgi:hypothetical protein
MLNKLVCDEQMPYLRVSLLDTSIKKDTSRKNKKT